MASMDEIKLSLSQAGPSGELSVIRVDGVVDTITASELEAVIENLVGQQKYKILVDLGGVEYISSAGWGIFVSRIQEIRENDGDIKLVNMISNVYEIYELLEFENIIEAFDSMDHGRKAFNISGGGGVSGSEKVWKTETKLALEPGMAMQTAMMPGTAGKTVASTAGPNLNKSRLSGGKPDEVVFNLVIEDPFCTISELKDMAGEVAPHLSFGWWKIFGILRRHKLLSRRARFRLARRKSRGR